MTTPIFLFGQFMAAKVGKTGLTVTVDVDAYELATGTRTTPVTAGSGVEARNGIYFYRLAAADPSLYDYTATFKTADSTVDAQHVPSWRGSLEQIIAAIIAASLDVAVSTRLASASYTTPPTAAAVADEVRVELATELARIDDEITSRADATNYTAERAAKLDLLSAASVTVASPVASDGTAITLIYGDDYYNADGRALAFTGASWPTLTGGTVTLRIQTAAGVVAITGTVTGADACRFDVTKTQVESLGVGVWGYDLEAALVTSAHIATLAQGYVTVAQDVR